MLALLCEAYDEDEIGGEKRTVLRLHPSMAPIKVAVLPLLRKDGHPEKAREIYEALRRRMPAEYDDGGNIGKRYRRQDEIGTPFGVTIDHQLEDDTVTLRDRDTLAQERVAIEDLAALLESKLGCENEHPGKRGSPPRELLTLGGVTGAAEPEGALRSQNRGHPRSDSRVVGVAAVRGRAKQGKRPIAGGRLAEKRRVPGRQGALRGQPEPLGPVAVGGGGGPCLLYETDQEDLGSYEATSAGTSLPEFFAEVLHHTRLSTRSRPFFI